MNIRTVNAAYGWRWISAGMQLFRRNPAQWLLMLGALFVASRVLSLIPFAPLLATLITPHILAGLTHGAQALDQGKPLRNGYLISGFLRNAVPLITIGGVLLLGQFLTSIVIVLVGGDAFSDFAKAALSQGGATPENLSGMRAALPRILFTLLAALAALVTVMTATWFATLLVFFDDVKPLAAIYLSLLACLRNARPLVIFWIILLIPLFVFTRIGLVVRQVDLGLWLLAPLIVPSIYASYRDLFVRTPTAA